MGELQNMPQLEIPADELSDWGNHWLGTTNDIVRAKTVAELEELQEELANAEGEDVIARLDKKIEKAEAKIRKGFAKKANAFDRQQSVNFASFIDLAFGRALAGMLGDIKIQTEGGTALIPPDPDCVEVGPVRIIGGIRPQNYDAAYRPDGPRVVFDSKSLNDKKSIAKNWQNMVNDLGTEATTVHTRFPYCIVAFAVVLPKPALEPKQQHDLVRTLERLGTRRQVIDQPHLAEAISLVVWDPEDGEICPEVPNAGSDLRIERLHEIIQPIYFDRYKGLPPHV